MRRRRIPVIPLMALFSLAIRGPAAGSPIGPARPEVERHTYPVRASNCRDAILGCRVPDQITASCPRSKTEAATSKPTLHIAGLTCSSFKESHKIRLLSQLRFGGNALCTATINRIEVVHTIRVYTPRWVDMPEDISDEAKKVWTEWRKHIEDHEQKHVSIYLRAHARLIKQLRGAGPVQRRGSSTREAEQAAGDELNDKIQEINRRIMGEAEAENRELDRKEGIITPPRCPDADSELSSQ